MGGPPAKKRPRGRVPENRQPLIDAVMEVERAFDIVQTMRAAAHAQGISEKEVDRRIERWWARNLRDFGAPRRGRPKRDWPIAILALALFESGWSLRQIHEWLGRMKMSYGHLELTYTGQSEKPYYREAKRWVAAGEREMRKRMGTGLYKAWLRVLRARPFPKIGDRVQTPDGPGVMIGLAIPQFYGELRISARRQAQAPLSAATNVSPLERGNS